MPVEYGTGKPRCAYRPHRPLNLHREGHLGTKYQSRIGNEQSAPESGTKLSGERALSRSFWADQLDFDRDGRALAGTVFEVADNSSLALHSLYKALHGSKLRGVETDLAFALWDGYRFHTRPQRRVRPLPWH